MKKITSEVSAHKQQYGDIVATVHDKHGNLLQKVEQPVDSFNRQMWRWLQANFAASGNFRTFDLTNVSRNPSPESIYGYKADGGVSTYTGIIVGSGSNPTTYDTVVLQTSVDHGSGNGQLQYQENTAEFDSVNLISTLTRTFVNISENQANITVSEVAISVSAGGTQTAKTSGIMTVRDVLASSLTIPFEGTLSVQYRLRISNGNRNYINAVILPYGTPRGNTTVNWTNTKGSIVNLGSGIAQMNLRSEEGQLFRGIVFGTSNAAFNVDQIDLVSNITHGNGAGQLFYHPTTNGVMEENSATNSMRFIFTRSVENRSGSNISISEAGLFTGGSAASYFMFDRKVIDPPVTVTNGNIVAFTWEFCYTV
jgi:hypothetical protein